VEVKIGVQNVAREIVLESAQSTQEVEKAVADALAAGDVLSLTDDKGRVVLVPVASLGYVDIGTARKAGVGFGTI